MPCEVVALDNLAVPEADHGVHRPTDDLSRGGVCARRYPLLMPVFLVEKLADILAAIPA